VLDLTQKSIIDCVGAKGARLKLAKRKLDNLGYMNGNCGMQNSDKRLKRMKSQLELYESIACMKRMSSEEDESVLEKVKEEIKMMAPGAAKKYVMSGKVTKKEICVLLFIAFGLFLKETSIRRQTLGNCLRSILQERLWIRSKSCMFRMTK